MTRWTPGSLPRLFLALASLLAAAGVAAPAAARPISRPTWLKQTLVTEYYPVPERWFTGRLVQAPGLHGRHRIDWLYSARGLSMEGDGVALDGGRHHIAGLGDRGWINREGRRTAPGRRGWSHGRPYWRAGGYWKNEQGGPTFPLQVGGWLTGTGREYVPITGVSFAPGPSRPLRYYESVAVDPRLIPLGSRIYIPAYRGLTRSRGWFAAADTGNAIIGRHVDVYRPAPPTLNDTGRVFASERIFVRPPAPTSP